MILYTDLDNTVIYSYKHDIGEEKRKVELYQGREISFITERTHELLLEVREKMLVVPTSTRTIEQYNRIDLETGAFKYALVCNGGVLLIDGKKDEEWYRESVRMVNMALGEMQKAVDFLERDERRSFELRFIEELFLFTKCEAPEEVVKDLKDFLDCSIVDVFNNGTKVYVVPTTLNKGAAIQRFANYIGDDIKIAAGDSEFDKPMLKAAEVGIGPQGFKENFDVDFDMREMSGKVVFSEEMLEECLKEYEKRTGVRE